MKNIFLVIIVGILLIGIISAINTKTYEPQTQTITIGDKAWYDVFGWFGTEQTKAELTLNTPRVYKVGAGYNKIAEINFSSAEDFKIYLDNSNFKLYNINDGMKPIERPLDFKYKIIKDYIVEDYLCENEKDKNETNYENCHIVGSHIEQREEWLDTSSLEWTENKIYTVGIFTYVEVNDRVEWIPTLYGVEIPEWAEWTASLNVELVGYWKMDILNATGNGTFDNITETDNRQIFGGVVQVIPGKVNNSILFNATGDRFSVPNVSYNLNGDFSINYWLNQTSTASAEQFGFFISTSKGGGSDRLGIQTRSSTTVQNDIRLGNGTLQTRNTNKTITANQWSMITLTKEGQDIKIYVDGVVGLVFTSPALPDLSAVYLHSPRFNQWTGGAIDEIGFWNRTLADTEVTQLYNGGSGITYEDTFTDLSIILVSPIDEYNFSTSNINLLSNITTSSLSIENVSLLINGTINQTNVSGFDGLYNFSVNLNDGYYNWSVLAFGNDSLQYNASNGTLNFAVDTQNPELIFYSPAEEYNLLIHGQNLTLNVSIEDSTTFLHTCYYIYAGVQINFSCSTNPYNLSTNLVYNGSSNNVTLFANDTLGNNITYVYNWTVKVIDYGATYNNATIEGSTESFNNTIRLGSGYSLSNIDLIYNGTAEGGSEVSSGLDTILTKSGFIVPNVNADTNFTFYWNITLNDATVINLTAYNQTVYNVSFDNCTSGTNTLFNFTIVDEELQTALPNSTLEVAFNLYSLDRTTSVANFSDSFTTNPTSICLNIALLNNTIYSLDGIVRYEAEEFAIEYYNIVNYSLSNSSTLQQITLYDLNLSDSTEFQVTFTGDNYQPVENALIYLERRYIAEDSFKTVELPLTDSNGQTILHLVRNNVIYNIIVIKDGETLGTFNNLNAFCEDFTIGDCKINLNSADSNTDLFSYSDLGISFNPPFFNETSRDMTFSFVSLDGTSKTITMNVTRDNLFGNSSVCNATLTSSAGTLTCSISANIDDATLRTSIYVNGNLIIVQSIDTDSSNLGEGGYLALFVMAITFVLMFSGSKNGVLFVIILTFAGAIGLGMLTGSLFGIGVAGVWLITIVILGLYKLNKERPQ